MHEQRHEHAADGVGRLAASEAHGAGVHELAVLPGDPVHQYQLLLRHPAPRVVGSHGAGVLRLLDVLQRRAPDAGYTDGGFHQVAVGEQQPVLLQRDAQDDRHQDGGHHDPEDDGVHVVALRT